MNFTSNKLIIFLIEDILDRGSQPNVQYENI